MKEIVKNEEWLKLYRRLPINLISMPFPLRSQIVKAQTNTDPIYLERKATESRIPQTDSDLEHALLDISLTLNLFFKRPTTEWKYEKRSKKEETYFFPIDQFRLRLSGTKVDEAILPLNPLLIESSLYLLGGVDIENELSVNPFTPKPVHAIMSEMWNHYLQQYSPKTKND
jgi:hypothetical protein